MSLPSRLFGKHTHIAQSPFRPGQVWRYHTRPGDDASTILILAVDDSSGTEAVVHIQVRGLALPSSAGMRPISVVGHMPISLAHLQQSVLALLPEPEPIPDHSEALQLWHEGGGGVWGIPVADAIDHIASTLVAPDSVRPL